MFLSQELLPRSLTSFQAGGNLGPAILNALDKDPQFTVSVLSRKTSKSTFPSHIKVHQIDDSYPEDQLLSAFKGQDAIVSTINAATNQHVIIEAAVKAGVKRYIPSEFGGDTTNAKVVEVVPVFKGKLAVVDSLKKQESNGLSWTALVTGPFFDWSVGQANLNPSSGYVLTFTTGASKSNSLGSTLRRRRQRSSTQATTNGPLLLSQLSVSPFAESSRNQRRQQTSTSSSILS